MNNTMKVIATLCVAATLTMTGCKKEKIEPTTPDTPAVENVFVGTSWEAHLENSYTDPEYGIGMEISYDLALDFLDSVNAELFQEVYLYVPAYPAASQDMNMTEELTYTITGDSVYMYGTTVDEETGDTVDYTYGFAYDKEANTLTLDFGDSDMRELMGTSVVVFTQRVEPAAKPTVVPAPKADGKLNWSRLMAKLTRALGL